MGTISGPIGGFLFRKRAYRRGNCGKKRQKTLKNGVIGRLFKKILKNFRLTLDYYRFILYNIRVYMWEHIF